MKLAQNPFFRKAVTPWHDSDLFCIAVAAVMALVFSFGRIGLRVASGMEAYHGYGWVPILLMVLSGIVLGANIIRILIRMAGRRSDEEE
jgi:uncharacterized membrane protein